ncbi:acyl carrier protein [Lysinibacillus sp. B2A1]|nr:acyl carrier protein [Lysinibacillus sp. B2A1]
MKLQQVFADSLGVAIDQVSDELTYNSIPEWDSVAHMALVAEIEDQFDIMLDTDDVLELSSFSKAKEIINKYNIEL